LIAGFLLAACVRPGTHPISCSPQARWFKDKAVFTVPVRGSVVRLDGEWNPLGLSPDSLERLRAGEDIHITGSLPYGWGMRFTAQGRRYEVGAYLRSDETRRARTMPLDAALARAPFNGLFVWDTPRSGSEAAYADPAFSDARITVKQVGGRCIQLTLRGRSAVRRLVSLAPTQMWAFEHWAAGPTDSVPAASGLPALR
jgi:hypothetical protein